MVRTLYFHCSRGMGLILDQGTKVAQMEQCSQRQKKVKLQNNKSIILLNKLKFMGKNPFSKIGPSFAHSPVNFINIKFKGIGKI